MVSRARRELAWRACRGWGWLGERLRGEVQIPSGVNERVRFRCNLCGTHCDVPASAIDREARSCRALRIYGTLARNRAFAHDGTVRSQHHPSRTARAGRTLPVWGFPMLRATRMTWLAALRISTHSSTASRAWTLPKSIRAGRQNTTSSFPAMSSSTLRRQWFKRSAMLTPVAQARGFLILTVPFTLDLDTVEHFPLLHDYRIEKADGGWLLENRTVDGEREVFTRSRLPRRRRGALWKCGGSHEQDWSASLQRRGFRDFAWRMKRFQPTAFTGRSRVVFRWSLTPEAGPFG